MSIESNIAAAIKSRMGDMSERIACEQSGIPRQSFRGYRTGTLSPSLESLVKLCQWLGVSADSLLGLPSVRISQKGNIIYTIDVTQEDIDADLCGGSPDPFAPDPVSRAMTRALGMPVTTTLTDVCAAGTEYRKGWRVKAPDCVFAFLTDFFTRQPVTPFQFDFMRP